MFDKEYFLNRLANGEDMNIIGQEVADAMNAAMTEYNAKVEAEKAAKAAEVEKETEKRNLINEMVDIIKELAILEGVDAEDLNITDEEVDQLATAFTEMFNMMRELKKIATALEARETSVRPAPVSKPKTDDQVLADFVKMFM